MKQQINSGNHKIYKQTTCNGAFYRCTTGLHCHYNVMLLSIVNAYQWFKLSFFDKVKLGDEIIEMLVTCIDVRFLHSQNITEWIEEQGTNCSNNQVLPEKQENDYRLVADAHILAKCRRREFFFSAFYYGKLRCNSTNFLLNFHGS